MGEATMGEILCEKTFGASAFCGSDFYSINFYLGFNMKRIVFASLCLAICTSIHAGEVVRIWSPGKHTDSIQQMIAEGRCVPAVEALKAGLAEKKPEVTLLAGTMYEEGLCVKANWDRAAGLYMRAQDAGQRFALEHLIAGYARPGRDNSMALYWAVQAPAHMGLPQECLPVADPLKDPDGFAAAIDKMPPAVFQSCVYTAGVVAQIFSETSYPPLALDWNVTGKLLMVFDPAANTVDWLTEALNVQATAPSGIRNDAAEDLLQNPKAVKNSLVNYLKGKGDFALKRFARPSTWGLDRTFRYKREIVFSIE